MSTKKLIGLFSIFLLTGIAFTSFNVSAHNPMHLDFDYDMDTDVLMVTFIHGVTDPSYHYVSSVEIKVNHSTVRTEFYTSQPTTNIFTYEFTGIIAEYNATIEVIAVCSIEGSYSGKLHVGIGYWEDKGSFASVTWPTILSTLLVAIIVILPGISQKLKKRK